MRHLALWYGGLELWVELGEHGELVDALVDGLGAEVFEAFGAEAFYAEGGHG